MELWRDEKWGRMGKFRDAPEILTHKNFGCVPEFPPTTPFLDRLGYRFFTRQRAQYALREGAFEDFLDGADVVNLDFLQQFRMDVLANISLVLRGQNQFLNFRPARGENLFLDAADRQYMAAQSNLAGHRDFPDGKVG